MNIKESLILLDGELFRYIYYKDNQVEPKRTFDAYQLRVLSHDKDYDSGWLLINGEYKTIEEAVKSIVLK